MGKINVGGIAHPRRGGMLADDLHAVPTHMRDGQSAFKAFGVAGDKAESRPSAAFVSAIEKHLVAKADAKEGFARSDVLAQGLIQTFGFERIHGRAKATDPRQNQMTCTLRTASYRENK